MSSAAAHNEGGSVCLITVGLDPEVAETAKRVAVQESVEFLSAFPDYSQNLLDTQMLQQLQGAEALVCLIDFDKSQTLAAETATALLPLLNGRTALIAVSGQENPRLILQAMRAGCSEYLSQPLQAGQLSACLQKLRERWLLSPVRPTPAAGQVLVFLSVRGGAGATTAAVHLGTFLARRHDQKVLIVDLHPHLGHVALLLGMGPHRYNFHELLRNVARLDLTLLNGYVAHHSSGVDVLLSPDSLSETDLISADALGQAIRFFAGVYRYVLIDCPGGLGELNQTTIACCDQLFLVATPEVPALRDLARYVDRLLEWYVQPEKLKVVINRHDSDCSVTQDQIEKAIGHPVSITLPNSSGDLTREMLEVLKKAVQARLNIVVSGGTGAGKTTLLNVLSGFISERERIVTIEDSAELQLKQRHVVRLECRPPNVEGKGAVHQRELVINALRMRPDRIVIGEVRGGEALDMLQAMNTGHDGSLTTVHANSPRDALSHIETMALMANLSLPEKALRYQISSAIQILVQVSRMSDGTRRVTHITELTGTSGDIISLQDIFLFEKKGLGPNGKVLGRFRSTGIVPKFAEKLNDAGIPLDMKLLEVSQEV